MIAGISFKASPTKAQKIVIGQWLGCARFIWNAKCDEDAYLSQFARMYLPVGTYPPINQTFSQYKSEELSPWLSDCPSQILRNSAVNWHKTYQNFLQGRCKKPRRKKKSDRASIYLTRELFQFETCADGNVRLFIGSKRNNIGYLAIKFHGPFQKPNSLTISRRNGKYRVSFCYDDGINCDDLYSAQEHLDHLKTLEKEDLEKFTIGIDRGIVRPVQAGSKVFDFTEEQKRKKTGKEKYIKKMQKRLSKQKKSSKRRKRTKEKLSKSYEKIANIRKDFCHKTSRAIVDDENVKVIILESLKTSNMTKKPKAKIDEKTGTWQKNNRRAKASLNRSILDKGWHQLEAFLKYKSYPAGKALFKVPAFYTSQECADCGHTHPNNRKSQELFVCDCCGHSGNADHNAAEVIKKRAIHLILDSGTELSESGELLGKGRGAERKTRGAIANRAHGKEASKKKERALVA